MVFLPNIPPIHRIPNGPFSAPIPPKSLPASDLTWNPRINEKSKGKCVFGCIFLGPVIDNSFDRGSRGLVFRFKLCGFEFLHHGLNILICHNQINAVFISNYLVREKFQPLKGECHSVFPKFETLVF